MTPPRGTRPGGDAALVRRAALQLGLQTVTATLLIIALMIAVVGFLLERSTAAEEAAQLTATADRADDVVDPPDGMWIVLRTGHQLSATRNLPAGLPLIAALDRVAAGGAPEDTAISIGGHDYRVRTQVRPGSPGTQVQVVLDQAPAQARRMTLLGALARAGLIGLALTTIVGIWLGSCAVRPLQAALALQRRFVTDASHELRTPLTVLSTRAQMLRHKVQRPDADQTSLTREADSVVTDASRLAAILDDLLLIADLRAPTNTDVNVGTVVASVCDAARPGAADIGVTIDLDTPTHAMVHGAEAGLHRAVTAVVDNAVRHAATRVVATITAAHAKVVITIADDGPGIDAAVLPRLFERFATAGGAQPGQPRRYGIGLALVSDVVARHGGTVTAGNPPGSGAQFRIVLPSAHRTASRRLHPFHPGPRGRRYS